jgi:hypothetical protein
MSFTDKDIDFWIKNNYNVLFRGRAGVGKTAVILESFKRNNLKWLYFSASTLDPWVDFIGVPKEMKNDKGELYLGLVRPEAFQSDEVEAIFLDEYNRSPKKIRNAVMELIQFKSINGRKFNNLKIVWAAINPEDDDEQTYDVEALDPAQIDRFHAVVDVPYKPSADYFRTKYGKETADSALTWWGGLDNKTKLLVSPRRLDYVIDIYSKSGNIRYALPKEAPVDKLLHELKSGPIIRQLENLFTKKDSATSAKFLAEENNYSSCKEYIAEKTKYVKFFVPLLPKEKIVALSNASTEVQNFVFDTGNYGTFGDVLKEIATAGTSKLARRASEVISRCEKKPVSVTTTVDANIDLNSNSIPYWHTKMTVIDFASKVAYMKDAGRMSNDRYNTYYTLQSYLPQTFDKQSAEKAFELLTELATRTQIDVIKSRMPKLIPMLNYVMDYMAKDTKTVFKPSGKYFNRNYLKVKFPTTAGFVLSPRI